jgi:hypothetical protein
MVIAAIASSSMRIRRTIVTLLLLSALAPLSAAAQPPARHAGATGRSVSAQRSSSRLASRAARPRPSSHRRGLRGLLSAARALGARETLGFLRQELQLYRGRRLERLADRAAYGKSDFDPQRNVAENLAELAADAGLPTFTRRIGGRDVLHVVVDLGRGRQSKRTLRRVFRRVAQSTVEVNFKAPGGSNAAGHVAVRVGGGATYDMTPGVPLPEPVLRSVRRMAGRDSIFMARKRSLRRFMEGRKDIGTPAVYYGMLFQASPADVRALEQTYERRLFDVKEFAYAGGDPERGEFSCAQFLTHEVPFLAERGVASTAGARSAASAAARSPQLAAVIVYKTARTPIDQLPEL